MFCIRSLRRRCSSPCVKVIQKVNYSRRNNDDTRSIVVNFSQESFKNFDNTVTEYDPNWELLMPVGYRFYLPGSIGHGWSDAGSTLRMEFRNLLLSDGQNNERSKTFHRSLNRVAKKSLFCEIQECPKLLRKDIKEIFPAWLEVMFPEMTIVTIILKPKSKSVRWSTVMEYEDLVKSFVLSASYVCNQLRMARHWADFINPFSGKPHIGQQKINETITINNHLNRSSFKIEDNNNCKIISQNKRNHSFVGCLYTTASSNNPFLQELLNDISEN